MSDTTFIDTAEYDHELDYTKLTFRRNCIQYDIIISYFDIKRIHLYPNHVLCISQVHPAYYKQIQINGSTHSVLSIYLELVKKMSQLNLNIRSGDLIDDQSLDDNSLCAVCMYGFSKRGDIVRLLCCRQPLHYDCFVKLHSTNSFKCPLCRCENCPFCNNEEMNRCIPINGKEMILPTVSNERSK